MSSLLLISQLLIPTLPANVTQDNWVKALVETVPCVKYAEEDSIVHALKDGSGEELVTQKLIVVVKNPKKLSQCVKAVEKKVEGIKIDDVLTSLGMFIVSYDVPAILLDDTQKGKGEEEGEFGCLAIDPGVCPQ